MAVVPGSSPMKVIVAGGSADGKTVNLARGSAVQIDFAEQLGTGYSWSEKNCSNAGSVISQIKAQHVDSPGPGFPGKASVASFTFTADAPGACTVEFIYARPWIPQDPTAQTVTVTFAVK
jgi:predicted secreted protein